METKHTKGPWKIDINLPENARSVIARTSGGTPISANVQGPHTAAQDAANARLIACATEVIVELRRIVSWMEQYRESQ